MTEPEFTDLVARMRAKQVLYFKNRDSGTLRECKDYEKRVDAEVFRRQHPPKPDLFSNPQE